MRILNILKSVIKYNKDHNKFSKAFKVENYIDINIKYKYNDLKIVQKLKIPLYKKYNNVMEILMHLEKSIHDYILTSPSIFYNCKCQNTFNKDKLWDQHQQKDKEGSSEKTLN